MFVEENKTRLSDFAKMSQTLGARADYVQGGGGNTSVKLEDGKMAIKASGFRLADIETDKAYAVLDGAAIRAFYQEHEPADFADVEKEGAAFTKEQTLTIEGLTAVRPSVEAGFHSILKTFVAHTHSVYANLATCTTSCKEIATQAFADATYTFGWVPYTDPGSNLTFAIRDELARVEAESGKVPSVILMQNHGIIVHDDDVDTCLAIHADANERLAQVFGIHDGDFQKVELKEVAEGCYVDETAETIASLASGKYPYARLMEEPLYPDQMVFLTGTLFADADPVEEGTCSLDTTSGVVTYHMPKAKAQVIAETLAAVTFIMDRIDDKGYEVSAMGEAAKHFIANWESEKYRKSLAGK